MSDNRIDQENYDFPNQEQKEQYSMSPFGGTESIKTLFKNKRLMMSLGGMFAFYLMLYLVSHFFSGDGAQTQPVKIAQTTVKPAVQTSPPPQIDQNKPSDQDLLVKEQSVQLKEQLDVIQQLQTKIDQLMSRQSETQAQLNTLEGQYRVNIVDINEYINHQKAKEAALLQKAKVKKQAKPVYTYFTRAAIHGRAWVVDSKNHRDISVTIGDTIPSYGTVIAIDPDSGHIRTSSSRVIRYAPEDR